MSDPKLTPKQALFVKEYLVDLTQRDLRKGQVKIKGKTPKRQGSAPAPKFD